MSATTDMTTRASGSVTLRPVEVRDADECARILFEAFGAIHDRHGFARDFPSLEAARQLTTAFIANPSTWGVVAESGGRIVGSNFVDERGPIRGLGPITVEPRAHGRGIGRLLMNAALERTEGAAGIRLLQDSFNVASLSLYASLGFEVREPAVVLSGRPRSRAATGAEVRPLEEGDVQECEELCVAVHGFDRTNELRDAMRVSALSPSVAVRDRRITAYATTLTFFPAAHAVAETEGDMRALLVGTMALRDHAASFLLPTRQAGLFRWCLDQGLRVVKPMTYMTIGEYREPSGSWIPSVLY